MAKFSPGQIVMTIGVDELRDRGFSPLFYLNRHLNGDWGDMGEDDQGLNDEALRSGEDRLFSAYETVFGKIWIITEWDRSVTTVLLPSEY